MPDVQPLYKVVVCVNTTEDSKQRCKFMKEECSVMLLVQ